jgi:hypothetical protein
MKLRFRKADKHLHVVKESFEKLINAPAMHISLENKSSVRRRGFCWLSTLANIEC